MKKHLINLLIDKISLILVALFASVVFFSASYFLVVGIHISASRFVFLTCLIGYNAIVCGFGFKAKMVSAFRPVMFSFVILILFVEAPFIVLFFLYYLRIISPFPSYLPYGIGMIIFAALTLFYYERFLKWLN